MKTLYISIYKLMSLQYIDTMKRIGKWQQLSAAYLWLMTTVTAIPLEEFYPFGEENGDALLNRTVDGSSPVILPPFPLNFFGRSIMIFL